MTVLVLDGNENQAVAVVRSLGRRGYHVVIGADTAWSKAGLSRFAAESFRYTSPRADVEAFLEDVVQAIRRNTDPLVLPLTESSTLPLSARRDVLAAAGARLLMAPHDAVVRAFDKSCTQSTARACGVPTPITRVVETLSQAYAAALEIGYPLVLKGCASEHVTEGGTTVAAGAPLYARGQAALARAFARLRARSAAVLVQEFVPGRGVGYFALLRRGSLVAEFAHRRIRDVRPTGSGSAVRESIAVDPVLRAHSLAILRALEWHGVAMVEYRQRADGRLIFLEVNGRFWNSLALAIHAGVDFPGLLVEMHDHQPLAEPPPFQVGVRCRWLLGDVRHVAAVLRGPPPDYPGEFPARLQTVLAFLRPVPGTCHDNFALSDPLPELGDWAHFLFRRIPERLKQRGARVT